MNYRMISHGYDKFLHKQVTYTYTLNLKNGSVLYFQTNVSDFKSLQDIKNNQFLDCFIVVNDYNRSERLTCLTTFKTILELNKA